MVVVCHALLHTASGLRARAAAGPTGPFAGVPMLVKDLDGDAKADLLTGDGTGAGSHVTAFTGASLTGSPATVFGIDAFPGFNGGVFVG